MSIIGIANKISNDIISTEDAILAISIMNMKGSILASQLDRDLTRNLKYLYKINEFWDGQ
jgi:hypothetical protein